MCASAIFPVTIGSSPVTSVCGSLGAVLVLDVHPEAKLLEIEATPVDSDLVSHSLGFGARRSKHLCHWQPPALVPLAATLAPRFHRVVSVGMREPRLA